MQKILGFINGKYGVFLHVISLVFWFWMLYTTTRAEVQDQTTSYIIYFFIALTFLNLVMWYKRRSLKR